MEQAEKPIFLTSVFFTLIYLKENLKIKSLLLCGNVVAQEKWIVSNGGMPTKPS